MSTTYDRIAQSRPRIRRDVLFTRTPEGVLFHNADGGFAVNSASAYRFATLIVPYLDGRHRVADICAPLGPNQRNMVVELVDALYQRDLARDVPVETGPEADLPEALAQRFATQISYIEHYRDTPRTRFRRFRDTSVAVLGTGPMARACVRALVRNGTARIGVSGAADQSEPRLEDVIAEARELTDQGCPVEITVWETEDPDTWTGLTGYDVVVVVESECASGRTQRLLAAGVPDGVTLLPLWTLGERAVVGPLTTTGSPGCWICAALRLGANGDPGQAAELWSGAVTPMVRPGPSGTPTGPVAAMLGNLLGYEVFRITTEALPPETRNKVIVQNLASLDVLSEDLLPHPSCARCTSESVDDTVAGTPDLTALIDDGIPVSANGGLEPGEPDAEAEAVLAELDERKVLIGRYAGVFTRFDDERWTQTPIKISAVELSLDHTGRRTITAFDVHHVAGARRRALHTAAQVYAARVRTGTGGPASPDLPKVAPADLTLHSGITLTGPEPIRWHPATSLLTGTRWQVPAGAVRPLGPDNRDRAYHTGSAGDGAGASLAAAAWRGLRSALCHATLLDTVRGSTRPHRVALETVAGSPELEFLVKSAGNLGVTLELLDLTPDGSSGMPVLLALWADGATGETGWRVAAHASWTRAAVDAVRDLLGAVQLGRQLPAGQQVDPGDPLLADFDAATVLPAGDSAARTGAHHDRASASATLRESGYDALLVPTTPADLRVGGLVTARVLLARRADR